MSTSNREKNKEFLEMYDGFSDEIFRFCLAKTRSREEALDITQETFMKTWDYLRNGKKIDMVRAFLYKTARNLIIDRSRKKQAVSLDAILDESFDQGHLADESATPAGETLDQKQLIERLKALPEHHYDILVLRFIQELTISEIAALYKESENSISVKIHRAIRQAQKLFPNELYE